MLFIFLLMLPPRRGRGVDYTSLLMGSRDIALSSSTRAMHLSSNSAFSKKNEILSSKYPKRSNRVRTKNDRPDIFLEGQQLSHLNIVLYRELDLRGLEQQQAKLRLSTPLNKREQGQRIVSNPSHKANLSSFGARSVSTAKQKWGSMKSHMQCSSAFERRKTDKEEQKLKAVTSIFRGKSKTSGGEKKQLFYLGPNDLRGIKADSFIVVEYPSQQIVTGFYFKKVVEIASLTKIMTFYVVMRLLEQHSLDPRMQRVTIGETAAGMSGTSAQICQGDNYSIYELLHGLMLPSGNDAAVSLGEWGGSIQGDGYKYFVSLMNKTAQGLSMKNTTFGNAHGLPHPQSGSTAEDVSTLIWHCMKYPLFREIVQKKNYKCMTQNHGTRREVTWYNTNKLLRRPGWQGVKTGVTATAGPCLASLFCHSGRSWIIVLLRTTKLSRRFKETRRIMSLCLRRIGGIGSEAAIRGLQRQDIQLDSDNSQEEQQFNFTRNDAAQISKRNRILLNEL